MFGRRKFRTVEARKKYRIRSSILFFAWFFLALVCITGILFLFQQDFLRVKNIHVKTDGILKEQEITDFVNTELNGAYFNFFPKNSVILRHKKKIEQKIREHFPRVDAVNVERISIHTMSVIVNERIAESLWCGDVVPFVAYEKTNEEERIQEELWGTCYLMDGKGYIYAKAPVYSGNVFPRYYGSLESAEPVGQQFVHENEFSTWQYFYTTFIHNEVFPQALLFVDEHDIEIYLSNGIRVLAPREESADVMYNRLDTLLQSDTLDSTRKIDYVDFRFGAKVFVKYVENKL